MVSFTSGLICAILSIFFNGTFAVPFKLKRCKDVKLKPIIFQFYVALGVFLSSWLVIPFFPYNDSLSGDSSAGEQFRISNYAILSGFIFSISIAGSFKAVEMIGLTLAQSIWGALTVIVSFLWGVLDFGEHPRGPAFTLIGLLLILGGTRGIANTKELAEKFSRWCGCGNQGNQANNTNNSMNNENNDSIKDDDERFSVTIKMATISSPLTLNTSSTDVENNNRRLDTTSTDTVAAPSAAAKKTASQLIAGALVASAVGIGGATVLVPLQYVSSAEAGLVFVPSFGIGAIITAPVLIALDGWYFNNFEWKNFHVRETALVGMLSGLLWNMGNVLTIIAIPVVGYGTAYPIRQCSTFIAGIWGIYVFKEMQGAAVNVFFAFGLVITIGAVFLVIGQDMKA